MLTAIRAVGPGGNRRGPMAAGARWLPVAAALAICSLGLAGCGKSGNRAGRSPEATKAARPNDATAAPALDKELTNSLGMEMVLIPAGSFMMGASTSDPKKLATAFGEEWPFVSGYPRHRFTIPEPFYMSATEVTQAQWQKVMEKNPSLLKGENHPVERVSWYQAMQFCERLSAKEETRSYRLPTEAEWEYACRSGSAGDYCYGDDALRLGEHAWYRENSDSQTHPVATRKPNAWGLYDMHGNVWEWCLTKWQPTYRDYRNDNRLGGSEPRVLRGAAFFDDSRYVRCGCRRMHDPSDPYPRTGFRVVMEPRG